MSPRAQKLTSRKVFISYSRSDANRVAELAKDIESLGHEAWVDHQLSGGQSWWDQILLEIRNCDVFIFAVSAAAVDSRACMSEYDYGVALRRPVLPILVSEDLSDGLMPPALAALQRVDYTRQDKAAFAELNRALGSMPAPLPLPATLPQTPEVPASYLFDLKTEISDPGVMTPEHQNKLLNQLKTHLEAGHSRSDVLALVRRFRQRDDVVVRLDRELAELEGRLAEGTQGEAEASASQSASPSTPTGRPAAVRHQAPKAATSHPKGKTPPSVTVDSAKGFVGPDFAAIVREIVCRRAPAKDLFIAPKIPPPKLNNARVTCGVPPGEEILALIDMTVLGSANDALLFGRHAIYHHNPRSVPSKITIPYEALARDTLVATGGIFAPFINFGTGLKMSSAGSEFSIDVLRAMLADIRTTVAGMIGQNPNDPRPPVARPTSPHATTDAPDVGELVRSVLAKTGPQPDFFIAPNIPTKKLNNARTACGLPSDDEVLALIDLTLFGSASNAMLIGRRRIYYRYSYGSQFQKPIGPESLVIPFEEIGAERFALFDFRTIVSRERQLLWISGFGAAAAVRLLEDIRSLLIANGITEDTAGAGS